MGANLETVNTPDDDCSPPPEDFTGQGERKKQRKHLINTSMLPEELTSKYEVEDKIGSGSFGAVYKVKDKLTMVVYAAKYLDSRESNVSEVRIQLSQGL